MLNWIWSLHDGIFQNIILNIVFILIVILIGGILPLYERKLLSLTQRRVGPKFVGYKGRLQFIADALKVLLKEFTTLYKTNNSLFFFLPIIYLNVNILVFINVYWTYNCARTNLEYNLVFFLLVDFLLHILVTIVGFFLLNKYTKIASIRMVNLIFSLEIFLTLFYTLLLLILKTFTIQKGFLIGNNFPALLYFFIIIPQLLLYFLVETNKTPFDIVEAETEIIMGYHTEYSGFLFGLFVLAEYFHVFIQLYIIIVIFII